MADRYAPLEALKTKLAARYKRLVDELTEVERALALLDSDSRVRELDELTRKLGI